MKYISFLFACLYFSNSIAQNKVVMLDNFFNNEYKKNSTGEVEKFHYLWNDTNESGYSKWGDIFKKNGFALATLAAAPTLKNLKTASVYLVVDPDTDKETTTPNYLNKQHIKAIQQFVKKGGIFILMANDSVNAELKNFNLLTSSFGIYMNADSKSKVYNDVYEMAAFKIPPADTIFTTAKKVYLKEVTSLQLSKKAQPILQHHTENYCVAAVASYGKGKAIVIGDPWFYNEYLNGRLGTSNGWDNDKAANDFVKWLVKLTDK